MSTGSATAYGAALGLVTGLGDWALLQCYNGGHWHYVPPSQTLIEMAGPIILLPVGLWFAQVFSLIGDIVLTKLRKDDK
jgi:hypothetical protein